MTRTQKQRDLARQVHTQIYDRPDTHQQRVYLGKTECGTVACVAGWAVLLAYPNLQPRWAPAESYLKLLGITQIAEWVDNDDVSSIYVDDEAENLLGLVSSESGWLFNSIRTREEVLEFLDALAEDDESRVEDLIYY